jgi:sulfur carrier protein
VEAQTIQVNGERVPLAARMLGELLAERGLAQRRGIAAAVNGVVVHRARWASHVLHPGDVVEIVGAVQGG